MRPIFVFLLSIITIYLAKVISVQLPVSEFMQGIFWGCASLVGITFILHYSPVGSEQLCSPDEAEPSGVDSPQNISNVLYPKGDTRKGYNKEIEKKIKYYFKQYDKEHTELIDMGTTDAEPYNKLVRKYLMFCLRDAQAHKNEGGENGIK